MKIFNFKAQRPFHTLSHRHFLLIIPNEIIATHKNVGTISTVRVIPFIRRRKQLRRRHQNFNGQHRPGNRIPRRRTARQQFRAPVGSHVSASNNLFHSREKRKRGKARKQKKKEKKEKKKRKQRQIVEASSQTTTSVGRSRLRSKRRP